ncbi:hypothetical protein FHR49_000232 [Xanthomonas campestris]
MRGHADAARGMQALRHAAWGLLRFAPGACYGPGRQSIARRRPRQQPWWCRTKRGSDNRLIRNVPTRPAEIFAPLQSHAIDCREKFRCWPYARRTVGRICRGVDERPACAARKLTMHVVWSAATTHDAGRNVSCPGSEPHAPEARAAQAGGYQMRCAVTHAAPMSTACASATQHSLQAAASFMRCGPGWSHRTPTGDCTWPNPKRI